MGFKFCVFKCCDDFYSQVFNFAMFLQSLKTKVAKVNLVPRFLSYSGGRVGENRGNEVDGGWSWFVRAQLKTELLRALCYVTNQR